MKKAFAVFTSLIAVMMFVACGAPITGGAGIGVGGADSLGSISGKVVYNNAEDNSGIIVSIEKVSGAKTASVEKTVSEGAKSIEKSVLASTTTNAGGEYSFSGLTAGTYTVYASSNNSSEKAVFTNIVVAAGKSVTVEELKLTATGTVSGKVTLDKNGNGNAGFLVFVAGTSYMAITDDAGNYKISSVPAGSRYQMVVSKGDALFTLSASATVDAGNDTAMPEAYYNSTEKSAYAKINGSWTKLLAGTVAGPASGTQGIPCAATLYVSQSGNDETGDGTRANPFKTIHKAYEVIEKTLDEETTYIIKLLSNLEKHCAVKANPSFDLKLVIESDGTDVFTVKGWGSDGTRYNENYKYSKHFIVDGVLQDDYSEDDEVRDKLAGKKVYTNEIFWLENRGNILVRNINFSEFTYGFTIGLKSDCTGTITLENVEMTKMMDTYFSGASGNFVFNDVRLPEQKSTGGWFSNTINVTVNKMSFSGEAWAGLVFSNTRSGTLYWRGELIIKDGTFGKIDSGWSCKAINVYPPLVASDETSGAHGRVVIDGGTFYGNVYSESVMTRFIINGGAFNAPVTTKSSTLITGGTFNDSVTLEYTYYPQSTHKITGGTFKNNESLLQYYELDDLTDFSVVKGKTFMETSETIGRLALRDENNTIMAFYDGNRIVKFDDDAAGIRGVHRGIFYTFDHINKPWAEVKAAFEEMNRENDTDRVYDDVNYTVLALVKGETTAEMIEQMQAKIYKDKKMIRINEDYPYQHTVVFNVVE